MRAGESLQENIEGIRGAVLSLLIRKGRDLAVLRPLQHGRPAG